MLDAFYHGINLAMQAQIQEDLFESLKNILRVSVHNSGLAKLPEAVLDVYKYDNPVYKIIKRTMYYIKGLSTNLLYHVISFDLLIFNNCK